MIPRRTPRLVPLELLVHEDLHLEATVPFPFLVENTRLPAGTYRLRRAVRGLPGELVIERPDEDVRVLFLTESLQSRTPARETTWLFRVYGDRAFLSQIWEEHSLIGFGVHTARTERLVSWKAEVPETQRVHAYHGDPDDETPT